MGNVGPPPDGAELLQLHKSQSTCAHHPQWPTSPAHATEMGLELTALNLRLSKQNRIKMQKLNPRNAYLKEGTMTLNCNIH